MEHEIKYHSPVIHKVTNLFKNTNFNISFQTNNTIYNQLHVRIPLNKINSRDVYKLKYTTCNNSYVGQTGSSIGYDIANIQDTSKQVTQSHHTHCTF